MNGIPIRLVTGKSNDLVAESELIPPFNKWPDVMFWGQRIFVLLDVPVPGCLRPVAVYREAFTFSLPVVIDEPK